jgi:hypothetical protein
MNIVDIQAIPQKMGSAGAIQAFAARPARIRMMRKLQNVSHVPVVLKTK